MSMFRTNGNPPPHQIEVFVTSIIFAMAFLAVGYGLAYIYPVGDDPLLPLAYLRLQQVGWLVMGFSLLMGVPYQIGRYFVVWADHIWVGITMVAGAALGSLMFLGLVCVGFRSPWTAPITYAMVALVMASVAVPAFLHGAIVEKPRLIVIDAEPADEFEDLVHELRTLR